MIRNKMKKQGQGTERKANMLGEKKSGIGERARIGSIVFQRVESDQL